MQYGEEKRRMDSKGGGGAVCQCVYRRSDGAMGEEERKTGNSEGRICKNSSSGGDRGDEIGTVV